MLVREPAKNYANCSQEAANFLEILVSNFHVFLTQVLKADAPHLANGLAENLEKLIISVQVRFCALVPNLNSFVRFRAKASFLCRNVYTM